MKMFRQEVANERLEVQIDHPMNPAGIDTSALLTMLGLIAAVWAVVPSTARLSFRLSLNWFDWLVIWAALLIIHGFFFEPVLTTLGFPTFGPWLWGFDKSATQYLLFLLLAAFVYWRSRRTRLTRWNLGLFDNLSTSLLHAGKHEELADLLQRHLGSALDLAVSKSVRSRLADASIGEEHPACSVSTEECWARNRRGDMPGQSHECQRRERS